MITIPNSTIYQGSYVYVVDDGKLQRHPVSILWRNQQVSVVKSGLVSEQHLVTTLLGQVTSGTAVEEVLSVDEVLVKKTLKASDREVSL